MGPLRGVGPLDVADVFATLRVLDVRAPWRQGLRNARTLQQLSALASHVKRGPPGGR